MQRTRFAPQVRRFKPQLYDEVIGVLRQRSRTIIIVVIVALFVGYSVHTAVESRRTQAVARAIEEYMAVLDAEWVDADCMPDHCPKSSKSLPGVPTEIGPCLPPPRAASLGAGVRTYPRCAGAKQSGHL